MGTADIVQIASSIAAVVTLIVAILALKHSVSAAESARQSAAQERRLAFELNLLAEISRQYALSGTFSHIAGHLRVLVSSDSSGLELLRAASRISPSHNGEQLLAELYTQADLLSSTINIPLQEAKKQLLKDAINEELVAAIQRRTLSSPARDFSWLR